MSALLSTVALGLVIPFNLAPIPQDGEPADAPDERVRTVHERREGSDTLLFSNAGAPPIRIGAFAVWATLDGKIEKENSSTGLGSGGDKLKMQTDLDLDEWSPLYGLELVIEADSNLRLRAAAFGSEVDGTRRLTEFHRHDGNLFTPGEVLNSRLSMGFADLSIHFLPRQQNRRFNEIDLSIGVRAFNFKSRLRNDSGLSVSEHTAGAYPRFAMRGLIWFGRGIYLNLNGGIGGWAMGGQDSYYTVADFELNAQMGIRVIEQLEIEFGYWFQTFGTYQEQHHDLEQVSFNRHGVKVGVRLKF
jgi:hypothetical protein